MKQLLFLLCLVVPATGIADEAAKPPAEVPAPTVILPMTPVLQQPDVVPDIKPQVVSEMRVDEWYVIESQVELIIQQIPDNVVDISVSEGATGVTVRGKFADGNGRNETRKYTSPYVYFITADKPGKTELSIVLPGISKSTLASLTKYLDAKAGLPADDPQAISAENVAAITAMLPVIDEDSTIRQMLTVSGVGPNPPPDPEPGPDPRPEPDPGPSPVKAENVRICIVEDSMNRSPETAAVLNAIVGWSQFADAGNQYRLYDKITKEPAGVAAVAAAGTTPLPAMVVYDLKSGALLTATQLPGSFSGFKTIVEGLVK